MKKSIEVGSWYRIDGFHSGQIRWRVIKEEVWVDFLIKGTEFNVPLVISPKIPSFDPTLVLQAPNNLPTGLRPALRKNDPEQRPGNEVFEGSCQLS